MREMTVPATVDNIEVVTDFANAELKRMGCPRNIVSQIDIAVDELFGNIARYGYDAPGGPVTVRISATNVPPGVIITFIDKAAPFNPLRAKAPDVTLKPRERRIGGLGIHIVNKSMDSIDYVRENGRNILSIRKRF